VASGTWHAAKTEKSNSLQWLFHMPHATCDMPKQFALKIEFDGYQLIFF
jgi:hypothetical protein